MRRKIAGIAALALGVAMLAAAPAMGVGAQDPGADFRPQAVDPKVNEVTTIGATNYVELTNLANVNPATGSLNGWSLRLCSATGVLSTIYIFTTEGFQAMDQHMLIAAPGANTLGIAPDVVVPGLDIAPNGGVALYNPAGVKQDGVAFSSACFASTGEGASATDIAAPEASNVQGILRSVSRNETSSDFNVNRLDFSQQNASPLGLEG